MFPDLIIPILTFYILVVLQQIWDELKPIFGKRSGF